jgi:predicted ArsR family transcriptional regulator
MDFTKSTSLPTGQETPGDRRPGDRRPGERPAPGRAGLPGQRRTAVLDHLRSAGPARADEIARLLGVTTMAARQHLLALRAGGLVDFESVPVPVGRPAKRWFAVETAREAVAIDPIAQTDPNAGRGPVPGRDLTTELLAALVPAVGEKGAAAVLAQREKRVGKAYAKRIDRKAPLRARLERLAALRTAEGLPAEIAVSDDGWYLLVQHACPVAAAAGACPALCDGEARILRKALGKDVAVERRGHQADGAQRCAFAVRRR